MKCWMPSRMDGMLVTISRWHSQSSALVSPAIPLLQRCLLAVMQLHVLLLLGACSDKSLVLMLTMYVVPLHSVGLVVRYPVFRSSAADTMLATNRNLKPTPPCPAVTTFSTLPTISPSTRLYLLKWTKPPVPTSTSPTWSNLWASATMTPKPGIPTSTSVPRSYCFTGLPHFYSGSSQISRVATPHPRTCRTLALFSVLCRRIQAPRPQNSSSLEEKGSQMNGTTASIPLPSQT